MGEQISARRQRAWEVFEAMPPEWRECVHEYGYPIVHACRQAGVTDPRRLHQLVREIWDGARSYVDRKKPGGTLDWLLMQSGAGVPLSGLARAISNENLLILPKHPTRRMIQASLEAVSGFNVRCTKFEKHQRRLIAALAAEPNYVDRMNGAEERSLP